MRSDRPTQKEAFLIDEHKKGMSLFLVFGCHQPAAHDISKVNIFYLALP